MNVPACLPCRNRRESFPTAIGPLFTRPAPYFSIASARPVAQVKPERPRRIHRTLLEPLKRESQIVFYRLADSKIRRDGPEKFSTEQSMPGNRQDNRRMLRIRARSRQSSPARRRRRSVQHAMADQRRGANGIVDNNQDEVFRTARADAEVFHHLQVTVKLGLRQLSATMQCDVFV